MNTKVIILISFDSERILNFSLYHAKQSRKLYIHAFWFTQFPINAANFPTRWLCSHVVLERDVKKVVYAEPVYNVHDTIRVSIILQNQRKRDVT